MFTPQGRPPHGRQGHVTSSQIVKAAKKREAEGSTAVTTPRTRSGSGVTQNACLVRSNGAISKTPLQSNGIPSIGNKAVPHTPSTVSRTNGDTLNTRARINGDTPAPNEQVTLNTPDARLKATGAKSSRAASTTPAKSGKGVSVPGGRGVTSTPANSGRTSSTVSGRLNSSTPAFNDRVAVNTPISDGRANITTPVANGRSHASGATPARARPGGADRIATAPVAPGSSGSVDVEMALTAAEEAVTVKVGVRIRPLSESELSDETVCRAVRGDATRVLLECDQHRAQAFCYDHVLWSVDSADDLFHTQAQVYEKLAAPLLSSALDGYNVCMLAYGQTGSGKSYSMMGRLDTVGDGGDGVYDYHTDLCDLAGVIPRFSVELFTRAAAEHEFQTTVQVSYYEIYQERIRDLLSDTDSDNMNNNSNRRSELRVREHPTRGPHVVGLTIHPVCTWDEMKRVMDRGNRLRATASTGMNNKSSRSHAVLCLTINRTQVEQVDGETVETVRTSQASLVDLAGSERAAQAHTTGLRLKEGVHINKSLLTLGKVISALVDGGKAHIPYRESTLTWLLKESLGGNARTTMLATISPSSAHIEETLATLRYACKTNQIVNNVHVNEDPRARIIRELRAQVQHLLAEQAGCTGAARPSMTAAGGRDSAAVSHSDPSSAEQAAHDSPMAVKARLAIVRLKKQLHQKEIVLRAKDGELQEVKRRLAETASDHTRHPPHTASEAPPTGAEATTGTSAAAPPLREGRRQPCGAAPFSGQVSSPSLVQLLPDPALSEMVAYALPEGEAWLGSGPAAQLRLHGLLLEPKHCCVSRRGSRISLLPDAGAVCVNGAPTAVSTPLQHGDRLVLAGEVFLRLHLPARPLLGLKGFADARAELARNSEQRSIVEQKELKARIRRELLEELQQERAVEDTIRCLELEKQLQSLRDQVEELSARPPHLAPPREQPQPLDISVFESDLLQQIGRFENESFCSPTAGDASAAYDELPVAGCARADSAVAGIGTSAADLASSVQLDGLIYQANALLRKLGANVTLRSDLDLTGGAPRLSALVTDLTRRLCTSWSVEQLQHKVALLRQLAEEAASGGAVDLSLVLDSRSDWQRSQQRRRSHGGRRRCSLLRPGTATGADSQTNDGAEMCAAVGALLAPQVHRCVVWHVEGASSVLLGLQDFTRAVDTLETTWRAKEVESMPQCLVSTVSAWSRFGSAFTVWRRLRLHADEEEADSALESLDDAVSKLQNALGFVFQGVSGGMKTLTQEKLTACKQLIVRACRLLGTAAEPLLETSDTQMEQLEVGTLREFCAGVTMAVDHQLLEAVRGCEDAEVLITAAVDDSVLSAEPCTAPMLPATHELVASTRSWLERLRPLQTASPHGNTATLAEDSCRWLSRDDADASLSGRAERPPLLRRLRRLQTSADTLQTLRDAVSLLARVIHRHSEGDRLQLVALAAAARQLHYCRRQLSVLTCAADAGLRQSGAELTAAAGALLTLCRSAAGAADVSVSSVSLSSASVSSVSLAAGGSLCISADADAGDGWPLLASVLEPVAADAASPPSERQMAARLRRAVRQLSRSPVKSNLRSQHSPVKGGVQWKTSQAGPRAERRAAGRHHTPDVIPEKA